MTIFDVYDELFRAHSTLIHLKEHTGNFDLDDINLLMEGFNDTLDISLLYTNVRISLNNYSNTEIDTDDELFKYCTRLKQGIDKISTKYNISL